MPLRYFSRLSFTLRAAAMPISRRQRSILSSTPCYAICCMMFVEGTAKVACGMFCLRCSTRVPRCKKVLPLHAAALLYKRARTRCLRCMSAYIQHLAIGVALQRDASPILKGCSGRQGGCSGRWWKEWLKEGCGNIMKEGMAAGGLVGITPRKVGRWKVRMV